MLFKKFRSVPANTTISAPVWNKLKVAKGEIIGWIIFFDPEAADVLHVRIEYHHVQIMPFSGSEWIVGFFSTDIIPEGLKIDAPPYTLDIYAYNDDDSYPHEYFIHPIMRSEEPVSVEVPSMTIPERFIDFFRGA